MRMVDGSQVAVSEGTKVGVAVGTDVSVGGGGREMVLLVELGGGSPVGIGGVVTGGGVSVRFVEVGGGGTSVVFVTGGGGISVVVGGGGGSVVGGGTTVVVGTVSGSESERLITGGVDEVGTTVFGSAPVAVAF
jgi:hypothetical protein